MAFQCKRQVMSSVAMPASLSLNSTDTALAYEAGPDQRAGSMPLKEADAVEIWIARWLRIPLKVLVARYQCDSRRLYEVWWGERFPASRGKAEVLFRDRYPGLADRTSYGYRRIPRGGPDDQQMGLFE